MPKISQLACFAVVSLSLLGCSTDSSSGRPTSQIQPFFDVQVDSANGGSTYLSAIMGEPDGSLTNVQLDSGDVISAKSDKDATIALPYDSSLQIYSTTIKNVTDRKTVTFVLTRSNGGGAPSSTVSIPDPITLTAPGANAKISAATGNVAVAWSNTNAAATAHFFAYPCGSAAGTTDDQSADDTGTFSFPVSSIVSAAPTAAGQCITLRIEREVPGTFDPAFDQGGTFGAERYDYVNFMLTP